MNKTQLVDALAERLGDRRTAAAAVEGLLATIVETVRSGDSVSLTGFGVFESRARAARTARNPRTGVAVNVPATTVPAFRPGSGFRAAVGAAPPANGSAAATKPRASAASPADADADADASAAAPAKREKNSGKAKNKDRAKDGAKARDKAGKGKKAKSKK